MRPDDPTVLRLREHLAEVEARYPDAWDILRGLRCEKADIGGWPAWCDVPLAGAYTICTGGDEPSFDLQKIQWVPIVGALGTWRMTQGIYRYDETLYRALVDTPVMGNLPVDLLYQLPEWAVYLETPGMRYGDVAQHGVILHLEWDVNTERPEFRALVDTDEGWQVAILHLTAPTIEGAMGAALHESLANLAKLHPQMAAGLEHVLSGDRVTSHQRTMEGWWASVLSLVLYLCVDGSDLMSSEDEPRLPRRPKPTKTKNGLVIFPAQAPTEWIVGRHIGAALRRAEESYGEGTHAGPRPHVRRAHWHTFLVGKGRRERRLHWVHPVLVALERGDIVPTIRLGTFAREHRAGWR